MLSYNCNIIRMVCTSPYICNSISQRMKLPKNELVRYGSFSLDIYTYGMRVFGFPHNSLRGHLHGIRMLVTCFSATSAGPQPISKHILSLELETDHFQSFFVQVFSTLGIRLRAKLLEHDGRFPTVHPGLHPSWRAMDKRWWGFLKWMEHLRSISTVP